MATDAPQLKRRAEHLCPKFQAAMDVLSRPWNGLVIATLEQEPMRFSELSERIDAIGDRMLSLRLKELVQLGLVERKVEEGPPVRVIYALTAVGQGFGKVQAAIAIWGETFAANATAAPARRAKRSPAKAPRAAGRLAP